MNNISEKNIDPTTLMRKIICITKICITLILSVYAITISFSSTGEDNITPYTNGGNRFICSHSEIEDSMTICVYLTKKEEYITIPLEELTVCSMYAEMSYLSPIEALKAQAVAIRSYCLYKTTHRCEKHPLADICDDSTHCLAFKTRQDILSSNEEKNDEILRSLEEIADSCKGEYLSYNGEYADAMFHDSSYRYTESYSSLYEKSKPYLISVPSNENAKLYKVSFSLEELMERLSIERGQLDVFSPIIGEIIKNDDSERVQYIYMFGKKFSGTEIRSALGLTSTSFTVSQSNSRIVFTAYGSGHGIGLSQSGAKQMAKEGFSYDEILYHYYSGCTLESPNK